MNQTRYLLSLLSLLWIFAGAGSAATLNYPGPGACSSTLQNCINSAAAGDVIEISAATVDETIYIQKSLTLTPAPGISAPVIGGGVTRRTINVDEGPAGETVDVRLVQLHLDNAHIDVDFQAGVDHRFLLTDSIIEIDQAGYNGISLYSTVSAKFFVERNTITSSVWGVSMHSVPAEGQTITYRILANTISTLNTAQNYGGIYFNLEGAGNTGASVHSNLIYNVTGCCANTAGIKVDSHDTSANNIQIINNTIDDVNTGHGLLVPAPDATSTLYVFFYNNIVTNIAQNWVNLPADQGSFDVFFNYNTYFNAGVAGYGGFAPGANTENQNPSYVDAANRDYRIGVFSSCLNTGTNSVASGIPIIDVQGGPRVLGGTADRGAFERSGSFLSQYLIFSDYFEDAVLNPNYSYAKGTWDEDGKNLTGSSERKASMLFSDSSICDVCSVDVHVRTSGNEVAGAQGKIWVLLWYQDKNNYVDLLIKEGSDKVLLRQHVNGSIVRKEKATMVLEPHTTYQFTIIHNGANFNVKTNGNGIIFFPVAGSISGKFGFEAKATTGYLADISIY